MEEHRNHHHQQQQQRRRQYYQQQQQQQQERHEGAAPEPSSERRIARSTSGKDRHSKVRTAKGLRDRRVRLSAHTAIRFYDVQDRLGFDRPSKAVDWLIRKAGPAIAELPPSPTAAPTSSPLGMATGSREEPLQLGEASTSLAGYNFDNSYLTPPLDSEVIAETIKSFFPIHHNNTMPSPPNFHNYHSQPLPYNTSNQVQEDLQLSLQSSHHPITTMTTTTTSNDPIALNTTQASWGEHHNPKMASWVTDSSSLNAMLGQNSYRPLQSTEPWINDNNQIQISQFGSGGFSNCFHIDDEHSDLSHK